MKSKLFTRLLCLAIALLLPLSALATAEPSLLEKALTDGKQVVTTISVTPGEDLSQDPILADLCKVLALRFTAQGDVGAFSLLLSQEEALTLNGRMDETGLFLDSPMLYDGVLYFAMADLQKVLETSMQSSGAGNEMFAQFQHGFNSGAMMGSTAAFGKDVTSMTEAEMREFFVKLTGDEDYADWVLALQKKAVITQGDFTADTHDPATTKVELTLTRDDLLPIFDMEIVKKNIRQQLAAIPENSSLTPEELETKVDEAVAEAKAELQKMEIQMDLTALQTDTDLISMTMPVTVKGKTTATDAEGTETEQDFTAYMNLDYNRLTTADKANHALNLTTGENDKPMLAINGFVNENKDGGFDMDFAVTGAEDSMNGALKGVYTPVENGGNGLLSLSSQGSEALVRFAQQTSEAAVDTKVDLFLKEGDAALMTLADTDKPTITLDINAALRDDDGSFQALLSATPETAAQPLQMSEQDMGIFMQTLAMNAQKLLMNILPKLPESLLRVVTSLLMNGGEAHPVSPQQDAPVAPPQTPALPAEPAVEPSATPSGN